MLNAGYTRKTLFMPFPELKAFFHHQVIIKAQVNIIISSSLRDHGCRAAFAGVAAGVPLPFRDYGTTAGGRARGWLAHTSRGGVVCA